MNPCPTELLFLAQLPPPVHGQAVVNQLILSSPPEGYVLHHIPLDASHLAGDTGKFGFGKVLRTFRTIFRAIRFRQRHPEVKTLYYPPGGSRLGLLRDAFLLACIRPFFPDVILHHHAGGIESILDSLPFWERRFILSSLSRPLLSIAVSPDGKAECQIFSPEHVAVVWNGVPDSPLPESAGESDLVNILFLGRLSEEKGILVFLAALAELRRKGLGFRSTIVGRADDPESLEDFRSFARREGLEDCLRWTGELTGAAKDQEFANADIYCNPTHYPFETCSLTGIEGFRFGKACVFSAWRGLPSLAADGEYALLFPPKDHHTLALTLESLISDRSKRQAFGEKARSRYLELFTEERFRLNLQKAFDSVFRNS